MMTDNNSKGPPGWSKDRLTEFLDRARSNQQATFFRLRNAVAVLNELNDVFYRLGSNMLNPQDLLLPFFFYRSHSAFMAACSTAMAGQLVETHTLLRSCLEFAAYALAIEKKPGARDIWLDQGKDEKSRKVANNAFRMDNIRPLVTGCDKLLGDIFNVLYVRAIQSGAHPNEFAIWQNLKIEKHSDGRNIKQIYLHDDGIALRDAIKSTGQVGLCALFIFQHIAVFTTRFKLLGLSERLQALRKRVDQMFPDHGRKRD